MRIPNILLKKRRPKILTITNKEKEYAKNLNRKVEVVKKPVTANCTMPKKL